MNRYSNIRADTLECAAWLVVGSDGTLRLTRGQPDTGRGEIAVSVSIRVPMSLFRKPLLRAEITVPAQAGITPEDAVQAVVSLFASSDIDIDAEVRVSP